MGLTFVCTVVLQLSALLSELGLNIREAHVFSTIDGFCLDVFVVDGWETEVNIEHDCLVLQHIFGAWLCPVFFLKLKAECSPFYEEKRDFELYK